MAEIRLLGIFEDAAQMDFHRGVVRRYAERWGFAVDVDSKLTHGCSFGFLAEYLSEADRYTGTLVAVDGKKLGESQKIDRLEKGLKRYGGVLPEPLLWSVATPSVEEWIMADPEAVMAALEEGKLSGSLRKAARPRRAAAERTAKQRLAQWLSELTGVPPLQGGREYAERVGWHVDERRVGRSRNPDLKALFEEKLPAFFSGMKGV